MMMRDVELDKDTTPAVDKPAPWLTSATMQQPTMFSADNDDASIRCHNRHGVSSRRRLVTSPLQCVFFPAAYNIHNTTLRRRQF